ncbi:MAG: hypothetical protein IPK50_13125 [Fibrobacterota bacterium]|nr:MAG: hypothetical protein IPK50_13125 [Fibrobacterota bacterium]
MKNLTQPPESMSLLCTIHQALLDNPDADGVHISIEPHAREMDNPDGTVSYMKALCWNLLKDGQDLSDDPELSVVGEDHTEESILEDLEKYFKGCSHLVDGDILIEEDPE